MGQSHRSRRWLQLSGAVALIAVCVGYQLLVPWAWASVPRATPALADTLLRNFLEDLRAHHNVLEHITEDPDGTRRAMPGYHLWATYGSVEHLCTATGQGPISTTDWSCINLEALGDRTTGIFCGGDVSTTHNCEGFRGRYPESCIVQRVDATVTTAPSGADIIVDVNECPTPTSCTSIWNTTQANRVTIASGLTSGVQTTFDDTGITEGNYMGFDVDQVGSSTAGSNLTVTVLCRPSD